MAFNRGIYWVVFTVAVLVGNAAAATYIVGDGLGWRVPTNGPAAYADWASRHVFRVGDVLVFNYPSGFHDVSMVTRQAFGNCNSTDPILLSTVGPTPITLNMAGQHYFICTFDRHCFFGQKLAINVTEVVSSAPAPSPAPAPISPSPTLAPGAVPVPSPASSVTPPSPASVAAPELPPSPSYASGNNSTPPSPSAAAAGMVTVTSPLVLLALTVVGLVV